MSFTATGTIIELFDEVQVTDKFRKREFVVDFGKGNEVPFQCVNANIKELEGHKVGDLVEIEFYINGKRWEKGNNVNWFVNLTAVGIVKK